MPSGIGSVSRVTATVVRLDMTYDDDLSLSLDQSVQGTESLLSNRNGGSGDNYLETLFDDNAQPITDGVAPFTGAFRPQTPLATFNGENSTGSVWLRLVDSSSATPPASWPGGRDDLGPTPQTIDFASRLIRRSPRARWTLSATATSGLPGDVHDRDPSGMRTIAGPGSPGVGRTCSIRCQPDGQLPVGPAPVVTRSFQVTPVVPGALTNLRVAMFPAARQAAIAGLPVKTGAHRCPDIGCGYRRPIRRPSLTPWTNTSGDDPPVLGLINGRPTGSRWPP